MFVQTLRLVYPLVVMPQTGQSSKHRNVFFVKRSNSGVEGISLEYILSPFTNEESSIILLIFLFWKCCCWKQKLNWMLLLIGRFTFESCGTLIILKA